MYLHPVVSCPSAHAAPNVRFPVRKSRHCEVELYCLRVASEQKVSCREQIRRAAWSVKSSMGQHIAPRNASLGLTFLSQAPRCHLILLFEIRHEQRHYFLPEPCPPPKGHVVLRHLATLAIKDEPRIELERYGQVLLISLALRTAEGKSSPA